MASRRKVADAVRSQKNAKSLQLEYARVLCGALLVPVLLYGSKGQGLESELGCGVGVVGVHFKKCEVEMS